jgi:hypothetical protein
MNDDAAPLYERLRMPGVSYPDREQNLPWRMPGWSRLAKNSPLGQKVNLLYANTSPPKAQVTDSFLWLPGDDGSDLDATQIQLVLGQPLAVPRDFAELEGVNVATATGEFSNAGMLSQAIYPGTSAPIIFPPLIYVVEWGIGGAKFRAEIDAVNGAAVNITASSMRVYGAISLDAATNAPGTSGIYTLAAFVGPGWPRDGSAQRTVFVGTIDTPETSDVFAVPAFAKDVTVSGGSPGTVTAGYVNFFQDPGGLNCVASYFINGNQPVSFRVPNAGLYFSITNGTGIDLIFTACFGLSI